MKKLLLVLSTILYLQSFSQFIIEDEDFGTQGDTIFYGVDSSFTDDLDNINIFGDSVIWDFSQLSVAFEDTSLFLKPSDLLNGNYFSSSDFGYEGPLFNSFVSVSSSEVVIDGISNSLSGLIDTSFLDSTLLSSIPENVAFKYGAGLHYLDLPASIGNFEEGEVEGNFSFYYGDSIMGFPADSIQIRETVEFTSFIDGFGTIVLPDDNYYSIRQNIEYKRTYGVYVGVFIFGFWSGFQPVLPDAFSINEHTYRWFGENQKFPLVEINTDSAQTFLTSKFQTIPPGLNTVEADSVIALSSISNLYDIKLNISKTNKGLNINSDQLLEKISITDILGRSELISGINSKNIEINLEYNGVYIIQAETKQGDMITKKISW